MHQPQPLNYQMLCRHVVNRNLKISLGSCKSIRLQRDVGENGKVSVEILINGL